MKNRSILFPCFLLLLVCAGCQQKKLKQPLPLAKLPDLAYPVVLPPAVPASPPPTVASTDVPTDAPVVPSKPQKARPKPRPTRQSGDKPGVATQPAEGPPQKVVISPGADASQSISAGLPHTDELHHRQTTTQLMQSTEDNLRMVNWQLSAEEQAIVDQIRNFMAQARVAAAENDLVRAHNLALKGHLLSDELVRR